MEAIINGLCLLTQFSILPKPNMKSKGNQTMNERQILEFNNIINCSSLNTGTAQRQNKYYNV